MWPSLKAPRLRADDVGQALGRIERPSTRGGRGAFVAGLLLGAVAGAAVALLCSPRDGKANRALLTEKVPALGEEAPALLERAKEEIRDRFGAGRAAYAQAASETRARMQRELDASQGGPPAPR